MALKPDLARAKLPPELRQTSEDAAGQNPNRSGHRSNDPLRWMSSRLSGLVLIFRRAGARKHGCDVAFAVSTQRQKNSLSQ
jgi:hypothetical protein